MELLSRTSRRLALVIAVCGVASASAEPSSSEPTEFEVLFISTDVPAPSVTSFITRQNVLKPYAIELKVSFLADSVEFANLLPE
jgi:hypothetical protein